MNSYTAVFLLIRTNEKETSTAPAPAFVARVDSASLSLHTITEIKLPRQKSQRAGAPDIFFLVAMMTSMTSSTTLSGVDAPDVTPMSQPKSRPPIAGKRNAMTVGFQGIFSADPGPAGVLLLSGGVESTVLLLQLRASGRQPVPLFADYSQRGAACGVGDWRGGRSR